MAGVITNTIHHLSLKTFRLTSAGPTALILALTLFAVLMTATGVSAKSLPDQQSREAPVSGSTVDTPPTLALPREGGGDSEPSNLTLQERGDSESSNLNFQGGVDFESLETENQSEASIAATEEVVATELELLADPEVDFPLSGASHEMTTDEPELKPEVEPESIEPLLDEPEA